MNLAIAVVLFGILLVGIGVPTTIPTVSEASECIISAADAQTRTQCRPTDPRAPAALAGLQPGDRFVSLDGVAIQDWDQVRSIIAASAGRTVSLVYERNGRQLTSQIPVIQTVRNTYDDQGKVNGTETVGVIGVRPATEYVSQSPVAALQTTGAFIGRAAGAVLEIPSRIPALWDAIFGGAERDINTPVGIVGAGRISGEILDLDTSGTEKAALFLQLLAGFNMSLFLINLLPLLPLDGGHILGAVIEWVRRGFAKLARRPDPGPFDVAKLMPVAYVVALLFVGLTVLTFVADVVNPVKLFG
jgi:membrane-associated protease RseP (regulator of RpoE activity)